MNLINTEFIYSVNVVKSKPSDYYWVDAKPEKRSLGFVKSSAVKEGYVNCWTDTPKDLESVLSTDKNFIINKAVDIKKCIWVKPFVQIHFNKNSCRIYFDTYEKALEYTEKEIAPKIKHIKY